MRIRYIVDYPNELDIVTDTPEVTADPPEEQCRDALINYIKTAPASAFSWWPDEAVGTALPPGRDLAPDPAPAPAPPAAPLASPSDTKGEASSPGEVSDQGVPLDPEERARVLKQAADIARRADEAMEAWEHQSAT